MANNVIAYVGIENYDYILYKAAILSKLGKRVLIIDHSETLFLKNSFPQPKGINCDSNLVTYQDIDFSTMPVNLDMINQYDDILISYGFNVTSLDIVYCGQMICVVDLLRYNHEKLLNLISTSLCIKHGIFKLLIRDFIETKNTLDSLVKQLNIKEEDITILYRDDRDYVNSLTCHLNRTFYPKYISNQLKKYILGEIKRWHPEIEFKHLWKAYRKAKKGD